MWALALLAALLGAQNEPTKPAPDLFQPDPAWKALGKDLWFDPAHRTLVLRARVALREGALEHLLCREQTKEHESILAISRRAPEHPRRPASDRRPGRPPRALPAAIRTPGRHPHPDRPPVVRYGWQDPQSRRPLLDQGRKDRQAADPQLGLRRQPVHPRRRDQARLLRGRRRRCHHRRQLHDSLLDLPIASSANDAERGFVANTAQIPPRNTRVTLLLRPATK